MQHLGTSGAPTFLKSSRGQGEEDSEVYERIRRGVVGGPVEVQSVSSRGSLIQPTSRGSIGCRHQGGLAPPRLYIPLLSCPKWGSPRAIEVGVSYNQSSGGLRQPDKWGSSYSQRGGRSTAATEVMVLYSHRSCGPLKPAKWGSPTAKAVGVSSCERSWDLLQSTGEDFVASSAANSSPCRVCVIPHRAHIGSSRGALRGPVEVQWGSIRSAIV